MKAVYFTLPGEFREWLAKNHAVTTELFVGFYKKASGQPGVSYSEALDEALCYGWIDGVRRSVNSKSYVIRFSPRKPKSIWSLVNVSRAEALQRAGKMAEPGIKAFAAREQHRTGIYAFEQKKPGLAAKYKKLFRENRGAWEFFTCQAPWYQRTAGYWVSSAKQEETRLRRLRRLMEDSQEGRRLDNLTPKVNRQPRQAKKLNRTRST